MNDIEIKQLCNGVESCHIKVGKFKTSRISINMFVKAEKKSVCANALLASILTTASKEYSDYTSLNKRLNELYGATIYGDVVKFGDMQLIKFVIAVIDDKYTINGEKVSGEAADLLLSMIFNPPLYNGLFKESDFDSKKRLLIEQIEGSVNDKRIYAITKTEGAMFEGEPAGLARYGDIETAKSLTNKDVVDAHDYLLKNAFVRVDVVSDSDATPIFNKIGEYFSKIDRNVKKENITVCHKTLSDVKSIEEHLDVTQGKLCMGFSFATDKTRQDTINAMIFVDIFGGGPYSKLFTNVREKLSLCYYCVARLDARKSTFMVDSGVLEENRQKAYDGILSQLDEMKKGNFSDEDLAASKMAICDSIRTINDLAANIDNWYVMRTFECEETIEENIKMVQNVTREDVIRIAETATLDTVYFLGGLKEGDAE